MRNDSSRIALRALRNLLGGARPLELEVSGAHVSCAVSQLGGETWPVGHPTLSKEADGPWPNGVAVECSWPGGRCQLVAEVGFWPSGQYQYDVFLRVRTQRG